MWLCDIRNHNCGIPKSNTIKSEIAKLVNRMLDEEITFLMNIITVMILKGVPIVSSINITDPYMYSVIKY